MALLVYTLILGYFMRAVRSEREVELGARTLENRSQRGSGAQRGTAVGGSAEPGGSRLLIPGELRVKSLLRYIGVMVCTHCRQGYA